jgi:hypothetical protein
MRFPASRLGMIFGVTLSGAVGAAACGGGGTASTTTGGHTGGHSGSSSSGGGETGHGGQGGGIFISTGSGGTQMQGFDVQPAALQTLTVPIGQTMPAVTYTATLDGQPISAGWGLDKGNVGTIPPGPSATAVFTPTGTTGGLVTVQAGLNMMVVQRQILVQLSGEQNGPNPGSPAEAGQIPGAVGDLKAGGGIGGVGGEGLGVAVDAGTLTVLASPAGNGAAQGLSLVYPYDKTVWPRGLLAPLLQWDWSVGDADAIQIELSTTTGSFSWKGTFGKPAILGQTGGKFVRHPIPQDIWTMATNTAGGSADQLTVKLTVAQGGQAYGPVVQTWTVAPARLSGTIYYNSYGTQLAKNDVGAVGGDQRYGGAVLSIRVGDTGPKLVAGGNAANNGADSMQCRVCHSVAANGSRLVVQQGNNYGLSSAYDLSPNGATEQMMPGATSWFPAIYPDGSLALTPSGQLRSLPTGTSTPVNGLAAVATSLGTPAFSPDGKLVAFNPMAGPAVTAPAQTLMVMSFDVATSTFSSPTIVVSDAGQPAATRPGWPAFFPDGKSVVFEHQSAPGTDAPDGALWTRKGANGQIAWTSVADANSVTPLDQLNGKGYLPKLAAASSLSCTADGVQVAAGAAGPGGIIASPDLDHGGDVDHNYEPTVNPIASGGYAWVVFTSRRMYGSVANIPPFCSDPRGVDLVINTTPKKLWVAAVDINGQLGTDPSHPAFYLPGQELLAGNSRGFWTLDPCRMDGQTCDTGDQCCGGFCEPSGPGGTLTCSNMPPGGTCSQPQEKCTTAADCCDKTNVCIGGFCAQKGPA